MHTHPAPETDMLSDLGAQILRRAQAVPDRSALQLVRPAGAERWSYARLATVLLGLATALHRQFGQGQTSQPETGSGIQPGFPVQWGDRIEPVLAVLAGRLAGLAPAALATTDDRTDTEATVLADHIRDLIDTPADPAIVAHLTGAAAARPNLLHQTPDRVLIAGALTGDVLTRAIAPVWAAGGTVLIPASGTPEAALPLFLRRFDATVLIAPSAQIDALIRGHPGLALPRLRAARATDTPPPGLMEAWRTATGTDLMPLADAPIPNPPPTQPSERSEN